MWNDESTNSSVKIYGANPDHDPLLDVALIDKATIRLKCQLPLRDKVFTASDDGITVNGIGFKEPTDIRCEHTSYVIFRVDNPFKGQAISLQTDGACYIKNFQTRLPGNIMKRSVTKSITALIVAEEKEIINYRGEKEKVPNVEFIKIMEGFYPIGKIPQTNRVIWNTIIHDERYLDRLRNSGVYLGVTYEEAKQRNYEIMQWALEADVEVPTEGGRSFIRKKMGALGKNDKVAGRDIPPHKWMGIEQ